MDEKNFYHRSIEKNLICLQEDIASLKPKQKINIIAVTKTHPPQILTVCKNLNLLHIAENRPQEIVEKFSSLPQLKTILQKHFIGRLQKNKIKYLVGLVDSIDAVDNISTLETIEQQFSKRDAHPVQILLQVNSTQEPHKGGISFQAVDEFKRLIEFCAHSQYLRVSGLMSMGPTPQNQIDSILDYNYIQETQKAFARTATLFNTLQIFGGENFCRLSMGMSHDYALAIQAGANEIRIGSLLFGERAQA